ncbi:MAG: hypothetical protein ACP5N2_06085 [Candidatus Nanoarchaeia archaeon]
MGKKPNNLEDEQLYKLFNKYAKYVSNSDERGLIIGYSILEALLNHEVKSKAKEEQQFEEIKSIYTTLGKKLDLLMSQEPLNIILTTVSEVDSKIRTEASLKSEIISEFLPILNKKRNSFNYIRNIGLQIYETVLEKGTFVGTKNILTNDYDTIKETFR